MSREKNRGDPYALCMMRNFDFSQILESGKKLDLRVYEQVIAPKLSRIEDIPSSITCRLQNHLFESTGRN
jgi:hypothetical protein